MTQTRRPATLAVRTNKRAHSPPERMAVPGTAGCSGRTERHVLSRLRPPSTAPDVMMTSAVSVGSLMDGVPSLEVRWILPGQPDTAVAAWFGTSVPHIESREDAYLLRPDLGGLSVKVRAGRALEVKVFLGSPGILDLQGLARGRLQHWQKWSFPFGSFGSFSQDTRGTGGWRRVRKRRRVVRFALTGGRIVPAVERGRQPAGQARCAVELTELRTQHRDWWSLGLEATGHAGLLRTGLEATAAQVFTEALPDRVQLSMADSTSYADWLRSRLGAEDDASA